VNPGLTKLVDALSPGATPVSLRRLRGGLGANMHLLRYEMPSGERRNAVLRRYISEWTDSTADDARYEFRVLGLLGTAGIAAPRPLLLDADGTYFGRPAMVLSYIPGRSFFYPHDDAAWVDGLARGLAEVHGVTPQRFDLRWLHPMHAYKDRLNRDLERIAENELAVQANEALLAFGDAIEPQGPALVHDDYWPGNTVWYRGRLAAVIDWGSASLGDPRADVAQCRADLVFSNGLGTADLFRERYEATTGVPVRELWYFDLFMGMRALLNYPRWLAGYHDAGLKHLELAGVGARIEAFVRRALDEAP